MTPWTGYPPDPGVSGWCTSKKVRDSAWSWFMRIEAEVIEEARRSESGPLPEPVVGGGEP